MNKGGNTSGGMQPSGPYAMPSLVVPSVTSAQPLPPIQPSTSGGSHLHAGSMPPVSGPPSTSAGGFMLPLLSGSATHQQASVSTAPTTPPIIPPLRFDPPGFITPPDHMRNPALRTSNPTRHFDVELPQQETESLRRQHYGGSSPTRFHEYRQDDGNQRSSLPPAMTIKKRKHAQTQLVASQPMTGESMHMAQDPSATLADADAQRNHVVAAASAQTVFSAMMVDINSGDSSRSAPARRDALELTRVLTGGSPRTAKKVKTQLDKTEKAGNLAKTEDVAKSIAKVAKWAADHPNNIDFGSAGRNMSQSNRGDGTVSPGRTRMLQRDYDILEQSKALATPYIGPELAAMNFNIPSSPGGSLQSSKRVSSTSYSHPAMPPLSLPPVPVAPTQPPTAFQFQPPNALGHGSMMPVMSPTLLASLGASPWPSSTTATTTTTPTGGHSTGGPAPGSGGKAGH